MKRKIYICDTKTLSEPVEMMLNIELDLLKSYKNNFRFADNCFERRFRTLKRV